METPLIGIHPYCFREPLHISAPPSTPPKWKSNIPHYPSSSLIIIIIPHHLSSSLIIPHHPSASLIVPHHCVISHAEAHAHRQLLAQPFFFSLPWSLQLQVSRPPWLPRKCSLWKSLCGVKHDWRVWEAKKMEKRMPLRSPRVGHVMPAATCRHRVFHFPHARRPVLVPRQCSRPHPCAGIGFSAFPPMRGLLAIHIRNPESGSVSGSGKADAPAVPQS